MMAFSHVAVSLFALVACADAFAPSQTSPVSTELNVNTIQHAGASLVAGIFLMSNVALTAPLTANAYDDEMFGSSQVIAARSGGRAGGRSSAGSYRKASPTPRPSAVAVPSRSYAPSTVIVAPPPVYGGYGYGGGFGSPGLGLGLGLSVIDGIGEGMREARQESEIRESRKELTEARIKEAELEARLRQLEAAQAK